MSATVDLFIPGQSWLHQTDPRVKLLFVAALLFLLILFKNLWVMSTILVALHLLHWSAHTPIKKILFIWKTLLPVGLLMMLLRTIFYPAGDVLFSFGILRLTTVGLAEGTVLALRIFSMALTVFAWLYTTTQSDLVQSLVRLGIPHAWGMVLALALRYIPTFQWTYTLISEAQQARGLDIKGRRGFQRVRLMMPIFIAMIITAFRASNQLAMALEARGYSSQRSQRTTLHSLRFRAADYLFVMILMLIFGILLFLYFWSGFGSHPVLLLS